MRIGVARARMAAAIAERIQLFDIADIERGLRRHPFAQSDLEGAVRERVERTGRQTRRQVGLSGLAGDQNLRFTRR